MHAAACVYDFVYRDLVLITRRQIHHSIFDIRYSPSISPSAFRVKPAFIVCTPRRAFTILFTGIWFLSPVAKFIIRYSIFDILHPFCFAFRVKSAFIVCTPRRAFTISFTGIWFLSPVAKFIIRSFDIRYSIFSIHFAVRISCQIGVYRMHAAACVYDFVYRDLVLISSSNSSFSIRLILYSPSISPFVSNRHLSYARRGVRLRFCLPNFVSYLL